MVDVKKQYRKLSLEFHPDRPTGNQEKFNKLTEAYQHILGAPRDPQLDRVVDVTLEQSFSGALVPVGEETVYIEIPPGIDDKEIVTAEGTRYTVRLTNDTRFVRQGLDLYYTHTLTLKEALCGFVFPLELLDGSTIRVNNEDGQIISPRQKKKISHYGMRRGHHAGHLYIVFDVRFPTQLSAEQQAAICTLF